MILSQVIVWGSSLVSCQSTAFSSNSPSKEEAELEVHTRTVPTR